MKKLLLGTLFVLLVVAFSIQVFASTSRSRITGCSTSWKSQFAGMADTTSNFILGPSTVVLMGIGNEDANQIFRQIQTHVESGCEVKFIYIADDVSDSEVCQVATVVKGRSEGSYSSVICEGKRTKYELKLAHNENIENPLSITRSTTSDYESEAFGANAYIPGERTQSIFIYTRK